MWEFAKKNNFTILTHDEDFEKLLLLNGTPPKVIVLKTFNQNTKQLAQTLLDKKTTIESFILNDELMILEIYELLQLKFPFQTFIRASANHQFKGSCFYQVFPSIVIES
nr:DUF5615 family PIN-like protein [uncultured Flavobacterium sp.]